MAKMKTLEDALYDEMRDIYHAEKQLTKALPKMAKHATSDKLREGFEEHLEQTKNQIGRLEQAFEALGKKASPKPCEAMKGLLKEGEELMEEDAEPEVMDALLIAAAQKVEHYEIATYGTLCQWAERIGQTQVKKLLGENLDEEEATDKKLTKLAKGGINKKAAG